MPENYENDTWLNKSDLDGNSQPRVLYGKYEILERVGKGGMGKVYRGRDKILKREVAVKEFSPAQEVDRDLWRELENAFQREATLLANLKHESLPVIFESFTENYNHYLVMEFVEGDDLKKRAKELRDKYDGQFPVEKVRKWAKDLLEVLIYLHERESPIFHRDIKPENLKIRNDKVCLLDFGLAKGSAGNISAASMTDQTTYGFTARYAPVEQTRGEKTTAQTDLYALAATFYYLITGVEPTDARRREKAIAEGENDPLRHVKTLRPEIDNAFAEIITQGLSVEAHYRPKSARQMLNALKTTEPVKVELPTEILHDIHRISIPTLPSPPPPIQTPIPMPRPSSIGFKAKAALFSIVGFAVLCIGAAIVWFLIDDNQSENTNNNSNQNVTISANKQKQLLMDHKLYPFPRPNDELGSLAKGTNVQIVEDPPRSKSGFWFKVKSGSKEGWIVCNKSKAEDCFASK